MCHLKVEKTGLLTYLLVHLGDARAGIHHVALKHVVVDLVAQFYSYTLALYVYRQLECARKPTARE